MSKAYLRANLMAQVGNGTPFVVADFKIPLKTESRNDPDGQSVYISAIPDLDGFSDGLAAFKTAIEEHS